jgi:hypothetical protein
LHPELRNDRSILGNLPTDARRSSELWNVLVNARLRINIADNAFQAAISASISFSSVSTTS